MFPRYASWLFICSLTFLLNYLKKTCVSFLIHLQDLVFQPAFQARDFMPTGGPARYKLGLGSNLSRYWPSLRLKI